MELLSATDLRFGSFPVLQVWKGNNLVWSKGFYWSGLGSDNNWSTAQNWNIRVPKPYDILQFAGTTRLAPFNDLTIDTPYNGIAFNAGAGAFALNGNRFVLNSGGITNNSSNTQIINNDIVLNANAGTINCATSSINLGGNISGSGTLTKTGSAALTLGGNNFYTGGTTVNAGMVKLGNSNALGTGTTTLNNAAIVDVNGKFNVQFVSLVDNPNSKIINTGVFVAMNFGSITINSMIDDSGGNGIGLTCGTGGRTPVFANINNKIRGSLDIFNGSVTFANMNAGTCGTGDIRHGNSSNFPQLIYNGSANSTLGSRNIYLVSNGGSGGGGVVTVNGTGTLTLSGVYAEPNSITKQLTLNGTNTGNNTVAGAITNSFTGTGVVSVVKSGVGKWILSGANTYTGATTIQGGTLQVSKTVGGITATASFTTTSLTADFGGVTPTTGSAYKFFPASTSPTNLTVTLTNAGGKTGTYNYTNSTLTIN